MKRAQTAGLTQKQNRDGSANMWEKYPRAMLRSRVISEGVRTIYPIASSGMYVPEEVVDFEEPRNVTPPPPPPETKPEENGNGKRKPKAIEKVVQQASKATENEEDSPIVALLKKVESATTEQSLQLYGEEVKTMRLSEDERDTVRTTYKA